MLRKIIALDVLFRQNINIHCDTCNNKCFHFSALKSLFEKNKENLEIPLKMQIQNCNKRLKYTIYIFVIQYYKELNKLHIREYTVSTKSIRTEKIFFKKTLFLKNKYYPARNIELI